MNNREIKFRAWEKGVMYNELAFITMNGGGMSSKPDRPLISPILMQFTGLLDKEGNEVYEGDLLRKPIRDEWDKTNYALYEVFFHDGDRAGDHIGYVMNRTHYHGSVCGGYIPRFLPSVVSKMIRVGNIYQNPELLNK
jgi:uncharacterized phage protein (TIGR01671 family)